MTKYRVQELHPAALEALEWLDRRMLRWPESVSDVHAAGMPEGVVYDATAERIEMVNRGLVVGIMRHAWDRRREHLGSQEGEANE